MHAARRFGILDALMLIAFTALGLAWCKASGVSPWQETSRSPFDEDNLNSTYVLSFAVLCHFLSLLLVAWTFVFPLLRFRKPRPSFRRLGRSPGTAACLTVLIVLAVSFVVTLAWWISRSYVWGSVGNDDPGLFEVCYEDVKNLCVQAGPAIIAIWSILGVIRKIRLERDWVEVFGFILALGWILLRFEGIITLWHY
jgi:hypothetical protein